MKNHEEKFVATSNRIVKGRLSTKAAVISFGQLAISISHLIAAAILSYYLTKTYYGTYRQIWLLYRIMTPIFTLGLPISINYFIPQLTKSKQKTFNIQTFLLLITLGFLLSSFLFFGSPLISNWFKNHEITELMRIFSPIPLLTLPTLYYQNLFVCLDKASIAAKLSLLMSSGYLISIFMPVLLGYSIKEIFIIFNIFSFLQLLIITYLMFKPFKKLKLEWKKTYLFRQLKYAIPIGLTTIVGLLSKQFDKLFISTFFSVSQFATYINGAFEIPLIGIITGSVTAILMPEFVKLLHEGNKVELIRIWHSAIRKVALIIIPVMTFLLIYAPEVLSLIFSKKYIDSSGIFRIYLLSLPVRITNYGMILLSLGLSSIVLKYSIYTLILNLILNYVLIQAIGFSGPAVATVIITYFLAFIQLKKIVQKLNVNLKEIFPWITLLKILFHAGGTGSISLITKLLMPMNEKIISLAIGFIIYIIIFFMLNFFLKVLTNKDLQIPIKIINNVFKK